MRQFSIPDLYILFDLGLAGVCLLTGSATLVLVYERHRVRRIQGDQQGSPFSLVFKFLHIDFWEKKYMTGDQLSNFQLRVNAAIKQGEACMLGWQ